MPSKWERYAPYVIFVIRIVASLLFFSHGAQKLWGFTGAPIEQSLLTQRGVAGLLETIGPVLFALGLFTRFTAFILCGEMCFAYFIRWAPLGFWPLANGGEEAILFCYMYLWIVTAGPGAWSVDGWLARQPFWRPARGWKQFLQSLEPYTRSILRVIVGFFILQHAARKAFGLLPLIGGRPGAPPFALDGLMPSVTGYLDLVTGTLIVLGLFMRPVSVVVAVEMILAYVLIAAPRGPWPITNGGGEVILHAIILAYFLVTDAGAWSLDRVRAGQA
jgi:putative oxidoreductase